MIGSNYDAETFPRHTPSFGGPDHLSDAFNRMFFRYNGADPGESDDYANRIQFLWSPEFLPLSPITFE